MTMECVCVPANNASNNVCNSMQICIPACVENTNVREPSKPICRPKLSKLNIDLCKILERSKDEKHKHDDFGCHYQGEKRQNLINKLKMYLGSCDDRPVIKVTGGNGGGGQRTGFGPMIKYPGYVDYNHPYFRCPYNKLPCLASTIKFTGGVNPCSPYPLCPESEFSICEGTGGAVVTGTGGKTSTTTGTGGNSCQCAKRRGEEPFCTASGKTRTDRYTSMRSETTTSTCVPPGGSGRYCCIPLPDNC